MHFTGLRIKSQLTRDCYWQSCLIVLHLGPTCFASCCASCIYQVFVKFASEFVSFFICWQHHPHIKLHRFKWIQAIFKLFKGAKCFFTTRIAVRSWEAFHFRSCSWEGANCFLSLILFLGIPFVHYSAFPIVFDIFLFWTFMKIMILCKSCFKILNNFDFLLIL